MLLQNNSINALKPDWFNKIWGDVVKHIDEGCIGGCFFEYSDELYKKNAPPDQIQLGVVELKEAFEDASGKSSLETDVFLADTVTRKPIIFAAVANGTVDGKPMNFNMDIFKFLNRSQEILSIAPTAAKPNAPAGPTSDAEEVPLTIMAGLLILTLFGLSFCCL
jgi:hypothetical protein